MAEAKGNNVPMLIGGVVVVLLVVGIVYFVTMPGHASSTIPYTSTISATGSTVPSTSIPQVTGGCPNINYRINNTITNTYGFVNYNISGTTDYVLSQGDSGTISYTTVVTPLAGQKPNILNESQLVSWANQVQYPISNGHMGNATGSSASGVSVSFAISQRNLTQNATQYNITATMYVTPQAPNGTYYITLGPGLPLCGAELALITVGDKPYNGTIPGYTAA